MSTATTPLQTSWETQFAAGEPAATIHVQNYQVTVRGPQDCWGRINQPLPALVSVQVSKVTPFADSAAGDSVRSDTVHYGKLSKYLQGLFDGLETVPDGRRLADLAGVLFERLAGLQIREGAVIKELQPFLERSSFKYLKVAVHLPKSSLLGNGVSLTASASMDDNGVPQARSLTLRIHDLRVPVLIGVNEHEKKTKQIMLVNVEVDRWVTREDEYRQLEAVVTKVLEESSLETLEALADVITTQVTLHLNALHPLEAENGWVVRVRLEKPVAVPLADAPCVEVRVDTRNVKTTS